MRDRDQFFSACVLRAWLDAGVSETECRRRLGTKVYVGARRVLTEGRTRWEAVPEDARRRLDAFFRILCWAVMERGFTPAEAVDWHIGREAEVERRPSRSGKGIGRAATPKTHLRNFVGCGK